MPQTPLALGLIETVGLAAAIEALDAALKMADVTALEIENSRGSGRQTVKIAGSVSAVKAAVEAGTEAARKVNDVYAATVIARPSGELEKYLQHLYPSADESPVPAEAEAGTPVDSAAAEPAGKPEDSGRKAANPKNEKRQPKNRNTV